MAELTADDHLTVDGDANIVVSADHEHALLGTAHCWGSHTSRRRLGRLASLECYTMLETAAPSVDATQSAAVKHSSDAKPNCDPPEASRSTSVDDKHCPIAVPPPAQRQPSLPSAPRGEAELARGPRCRGLQGHRGQPWGHQPWLGPCRYGYSSHLLTVNGTFRAAARFVTCVCISIT